MKIFATGSNDELCIGTTPLFVCVNADRSLIKAYSFEKAIAVRWILSQVAKFHKRRYTLRAELVNIGKIAVPQRGNIIAVLDPKKHVEVRIYHHKSDGRKELVCTFTEDSNPEHIKITSGLDVHNVIMGIMRKNLEASKVNETEQFELA